MKSSGTGGDSSRAKGLTASVALAITILIVVPSSATSGYPGGSFYPIIGAIGALAAGLWTSRLQLRSPPHVWWAVGFYAVLTGASVASGTLDPFSLLLPAVFLPMYWLTYSGTEVQKSSIARVILVLASIQALLGISETFFRAPPLLGDIFLSGAGNPFLDGLSRAQGTLGHPLVLCFVLLGALGLLLARGSRPLLRLAIAILYATAIVATGSATGLIVAALIITVWLIVNLNPLVVIFGIIGVTIFALISISEGWLFALLGDELDARNTSHRLNTINAIPSLIWDRPVLESLFGAGNSGVAGLYERGLIADDAFYTLDNQYVTFVATAGIVGASMAIVALVGISVRIKRPYLAGWGGLLAAGLSFDFLQWYAAGALFFAFISVAQRVTPHKKLTPEVEPDPLSRTPELRR